MRRIALLGLAFVAACVPQAQPPSEADSSQSLNEEAPVETNVEILPNLGPAPELQNEVWLNIDHPLRLAELRGQVVLIDMWTFG